MDIIIQTFNKHLTEATPSGSTESEFVRGAELLTKT
jgi:hypothetical protein